MKKRAVVTGIGAVSPNGIGREAFWDATRNGVSGVKPITRFDPSRFSVHIAGEVAGLRRKPYVRPKDRPHVSRCVPLGVAAAREALDDAGLEPARHDARRTAPASASSSARAAAARISPKSSTGSITAVSKSSAACTRFRPRTIGTLASEISMRFGFRGLSHIDLDRLHLFHRRHRLRLPQHSVGCC